MWGLDGFLFKCMIFFKEIYVRWRGVFKTIDFFVFWIVKWLKWKVSLERNFTNSSYVFILSINFENLTDKWYVFIIFFMFVKF